MKIQNIEHFLVHSLRATPLGYGPASVMAYSCWGATPTHSVTRAWIGYRDPETKKHYVFLTNNFKLSAKTIADIYKERWQIEIFFRWIKQNLKIKAFIGNSRNAVMTQIYVALIAYLLLCMFKYLSKIPGSLQNLLRVIQLNLFRRCCLEELFKPPPRVGDNAYINRQLTIAFC